MTIEDLIKQFNNQKHKSDLQQLQIIELEGAVRQAAKKVGRVQAQSLKDKVSDKIQHSVVTEVEAITERIALEENYFDQETQILDGDLPKPLDT